MKPPPPPPKQQQHSHAPKQSNFDNQGIIGDFDLKTSPSTAAFVQLKLEDDYLERRVEPRLKSNFKAGRAQAPDLPVASTLLATSTDAIYEGMQVIAEDDFWRCFEKTKVTAWNFNAPLLLLWTLGVFVRYFILFPLRLCILAMGWVVFGSAMVVANLLSPVLPKQAKDRFLRQMISNMSSCFVFTWSGVIRYHGHIPSADTQSGKSNYVFVANHSSLIDVIVLQQVKCFSLVGQQHKGIVWFLQEVVLASLQCIWFDRGEMKDRTIVAKKLQEHAKDARRNPLLVFPEGTCVNNEHVLQFKKGVFELGVPIAPVAIKYNKLFVDPFWSSRDQSFAGHIVELMTSWCMICDVYFLEPTVRRDGESGEDFARRVQHLIANKINIRAVDWDGYLKHFQPGERLINKRKELYAKQFQGLLTSLKEKRASQWDKLLSPLKEEEDEDAAAAVESSSGDESTLNGSPVPSLGRKNSTSSTATSQHQASGSGRFGPAVLGSTNLYQRMPFRSNSHSLATPSPSLPPTPIAAAVGGRGEEETGAPSF